MVIGIPRIGRNDFQVMRSSPCSWRTNLLVKISKITAVPIIPLRKAAFSKIRFLFRCVLVLNGSRTFHVQQTVRKSAHRWLFFLFFPDSVILFQRARLIRDYCMIVFSATWFQVASPMACGNTVLLIRTYYFMQCLRCDSTYRYPTGSSWEIIVGEVALYMKQTDLHQNKRKSSASSITFVPSTTGAFFLLYSCIASCVNERTRPVADNTYFSQQNLLYLFRHHDHFHPYSFCLRWPTESDHPSW